MLYPEMPKSKKKPSYIVGGIFALLVGIIIFLLFLPSFMDKNFGFKPWDWTTIIPNLNAEFFGAVGFYLKIALPIILFLCAVSSLFMGLSKSGGLFKGSIIASTLALVLKHSLEPANLTSSTENFLGYIEYGLIGVSLVLAILGIIFRFIGEEPYAPHRANSFHFFASFALIVIIGIDVFAPIFNISSILSNENYYIGTVFGLFLIIASVWMFCCSTRDPSEFGIGYERDSKIKAEQKGQDGKPEAPASQEAPAPAPENAQNEQPAPQNAAPSQPAVQNTQPEQNAQAPQPAPQPAPQQAPQPQPMPMPRPMSPRPPVSSVVSDGQQMPPRPPMPRPMPPRPPIAQNGQPMPPRPPVGPNGQPMPPRPPIAPTGQPQPGAQTTPFNPQQQNNQQTPQDEEN